MVDRSVDLGEAGVVVVAAGEEAAVVAEDDVRLLAAHHLDVLLLLQLPRAVPVEVFRLIINPRLDFPTLVDTISAEKEIVLKINPIEHKENKERGSCGNGRLLIHLYYSAHIVYLPSSALVDPV